MSFHSVLIAILVSVVAGSGARMGAPAASGTAQRGAPTAPEAFTCQAQARTADAASATNFRIQIDRYVADPDRKAMTDALTHGGYPGFVIALRKAPAIGKIQMGSESFIIRWAREQPAGTGRAITVVTDVPVYFVGGGRADAKPREGFELAVAQFTVDSSGMGSGTMAAAARVKPDGKGGVLLEDYAEEPIKLTFVRRVI